MGSFWVSNHLFYRTADGFFFEIGVINVVKALVYMAIVFFDILWSVRRKYKENVAMGKEVLPLPALSYG